MADPGRSRRLIRTPWGASNEEESRAYLQTRLTLLYKIMFWAYVLLVASQAVLWETTLKSKKPEHQNAIYVAAVAALVLMAVLWRICLVRHRLSFGWLYFLDYFYALGSGTVLGMAALFAYDYPPSHYVSLIYAYIAIFTRTIIVPSTGRRTLLAGSLCFGPMVTAAIILGITYNLMAPGHVFALGATLLSGVAIVLAASGSDIIYGLRQKVSAAQQLGAYKLERKIGEGGNGAVYLAHHIMLRRPTAVKLLLPDRVGAENVERFEREVQHMSQLTHPNTVAVFDYGRSPEGHFYYAMEYLGGGVDLQNLVAKYGPQPGGRVAQILGQVCGALSEAHDNQIIHRDIKPANIILCERGGMPDFVKVVDYGLVKEITAKGNVSTQVILGTPAYVAPEAITDPENVGPACDLYALGAVGYFLLTGKRVFEGKTAVDICIQHVTAQPKPPSQAAAIYVQPELEAILMKCLSKKPGDRFASAYDLAAALRGLPATKDWDLPDARLWWREFKTQDKEASRRADSSTMTITVDLGQRD
ncbi:MAG TPA: serine/threonine-protein kinase [Kofleriaceae bacterium]